MLLQPHLNIYRLSRWLYRNRIPLLPSALKPLNRVLFAVVLPPQAQIGRNVLISYQVLGVVLGRSAVVEDDAIILTGVTIGGRSGHSGGPVIGRGAMLGSGAKVLSDVTVGRYASIGANAVVLQDIPDFAAAAGVPARVIRIIPSEELPNYRKFG
jgi:serine O-acetyltransferase